MAICPKCGAPVDDGARFCVTCGAALGAPAAPAAPQPAAPVAPQPAAPVAPQSAAPVAPQPAAPVAPPPVPPVAPPPAAQYNAAPAGNYAAGPARPSIWTIYGRAFSVLMRRPIRLWGISLLFSFLVSVGSALCGFAIPILGISVVLLLQTSMTLIFLHGYRGEDDKVKAVSLFDAFKDWATIKRVLCGMGWMMLWIFLWSLIPIVGIIFALIRMYEYRLTPYILMMEPDVKPSEAIKVSKQRTMGWKGKMFGADILVYVCFFVVFLILMLLGRIPYAGILFMIILALFVIAFALFVGLFIGLVKAAFYEEICGNGGSPAPYVRQKKQKAPKGYDPYAQQPGVYQQQPPAGYPQQPAYPPQQTYQQAPAQPAYQPPTDVPPQA